MHHNHSYSVVNLMCFSLILKLRDNAEGDFGSMYRHISKGAWTLSEADISWQVSDCTAEGLKASTHQYKYYLSVMWTKFSHSMIGYAFLVTIGERYRSQGN